MNSVAFLKSILATFLLYLSYLCTETNPNGSVILNILITVSVVTSLLLMPIIDSVYKEELGKEENKKIYKILISIIMVTAIAGHLALTVSDLVEISEQKQHGLLMYLSISINYFVTCYSYFLICLYLISDKEKYTELKLKFLHSKVIFINKEKGNKLEISNLSNINQMIRKYPVYASKIADKLKEFEKYINMSKSHVIYLSNEQYENLTENEVVNFMFFASEIYRKKQEHGIVNSNCLQQKRKESDFDCLEDFKIYLNQLDFYKELFDFYSLKLRVKDFLNEKMSKNINDNELKFILELLDKDLELEEDKTAKFIKNCEKRFEKIKNNAMFGMIN